mmetsp:Transcript_24141/g.50559  ORF Transcript_24141/g.50559 Transcript_24141/m.50559 type:complete len:454 (-) Transcript_24141:665-2026(-)
MNRLIFTWLIISIASTAFKDVEALVLPTLFNAHHFLSASSINGSKWQHRLSISRSSPLTPLRPLHSLASSEESGEHKVQASADQDQKYWTLPRVYVGPRHNTPLNNILLKLGTIVHLSSEQAHYLTNVMRILKKSKKKRADGTITEGRNCIRIFDGKNGEWLAKVYASEEPQNASSRGRGKSRRNGRSSNRDVSLVAECIQQLRTQDCGDDRPWILFAPIRSRSRMKVMIEKCTELGAGRMIPVTSDHIERGALMALLESNGNEADLDVVYGGYNTSREKDRGITSFGKLEIQAVEAAEQCERLDIPIVTSDLSLTRPSENSQDTLWRVQDIVKQWCDNWGENYLKGGENAGTADCRTLLICRERASVADVNDGRARVVPVLRALNDNQRVSLLVGPEGGWSVEEEEIFDKICSKYIGRIDPPIRCVSLGTSVLRAETACMMAVGSWALTNDS